jgi:ComF family protein
MGGVPAVLGAIVDFLVEERCHGCGCRVATRSALSRPEHAASASLDDSVMRRVRTRLLCRACLLELEPWTHPTVLVGDTPGAAALELYPTFTTDRRLLILIHLLKFGRRECVAPWLGRAVARGLAARARSAGAVVVPVPMDPGARRRRGFNQAETMARAVAREWALPLACAALAKPLPTRAQSLLGRAGRRENLRGAFCPGRGAGIVRGRSVLLVDDLVTTGATARACADALAAAGAARVRVVCAGYRP